VSSSSPHVRFGEAALPSLNGDQRAQVIGELGRERTHKDKNESAEAAPTARAKAADLHRLAAEGMRREVIAAQLKIGVASVYRVLRVV
jgi:hypothetical protein